jgi:hypothetical protein
MADEGCPDWKQRADVRGNYSFVGYKDLLPLCLSSFPRLFERSSPANRGRNFARINAHHYLEATLLQPRNDCGKRSFHETLEQWLEEAARPLR